MTTPTISHRASRDGCVEILAAMMVAKKLKAPLVPAIALADYLIRWDEIVESSTPFAMSAMMEFVK